MRSDPLFLTGMSVFIYVHFQELDYGVKQGLVIFGHLVHLTPYRLISSSGGYEKDNFCTSPLPATLPELTGRIWTLNNVVTPTAITNAWTEFEYRLDMCLFVILYTAKNRGQQLDRIKYQKYSNISHLWLSLLEWWYINLLQPTGHVMHQQFNIQLLYVLPTLYLCVLYLSENKQRLVPLTA